jgi:hypothetical protein
MNDLRPRPCDPRLPPVSLMSDAIEPDPLPPNLIPIWWVLPPDGIRGSSLDFYGLRQSAGSTDPRRSRRINLFGKRLAECVVESDAVATDHAHSLPLHLILAGERLGPGSTPMASDS